MHEVKGSHSYAAPVDAVIAMLRDRDATVAKFEGMGHHDIEILECDEHDDELRVRTSRVVEVELPGFAKKMMKPTNTLIQDDDWHKREDGGWDGTFDIETHGSPIHMSGTMRLIPSNGSCTHEVNVNVDVKVPLIGGKIADWAAKNDVRRSVDAEFEFGDRWLAEHKV